MEQITLGDDMIENYKMVLAQYKPYEPDDPEYRMLDGKKDPMRVAATIAKRQLEKLEQKTE